MHDLSYPSLYHLGPSSLSAPSRSEMNTSSIFGIDDWSRNRQQTLQHYFDFGPYPLLHIVAVFTVFLALPESP